VRLGRALGWFWCAHAAACALGALWLLAELARILAGYDLMRDGLAQVAAFVAAYGLCVAVALAVFDWRLGRFARGRAPGSVPAFLAGALALHAGPVALAWIAAFGLGPPTLARPAAALVVLEAAIAVLTVGWLAASVRRAA
jgi:hypothetical protein